MIKTCAQSISHYLPQILHDSGRGIMQKGHYQDCLQQPQLKYSLVKFAVNGTDAHIFTGLCLPRECPDSIIGQYLNQTLVKNQSPVTIFAVQSDTENRDVSLDWSGWLTLTLFAVFTLLTVGGTVWHYLNRGKKKESNLLLSAFDLKRNLKHFQVRPNESLNIMDGVRAIAMMWVIYGHAHGFYIGAGIMNSFSLPDTANKAYFLLVYAGLLSVDIFFMLGGFFLAFIMLREHSSLPKFLMAVPQRALRIWPAYIMAMLFFSSVLGALGSGLQWPGMDFGTPCKTMWKDIFFVSNLVGEASDMCMGWGWYLQVDFQLFIVGLLLIALYKSYPKISMTLTTIMGVASLVFNYVYTYQNGIHIEADINGLTNPNQVGFFKYIYMSAYGRCTPYLMGLIFGMLYMAYRNYQKKKQEQVGVGFMCEVKKSLERSRLARVFVEWLGIGLMAFVTFSPRSFQTGFHWPQSLHSLCWMLSKPVFLFGTILTVLPTTLGIRGSFFDLLLTNRCFVFIARVSFCTYLLHLSIMDQYLYTRNYNQYYTIMDAMSLHLGITVLSLFFGFLLTMIVELPFANLQKHWIGYLMKGQRQGKPKSEAKVSLLTNEGNEDKTSRLMESQEILK